MRSSALLQQTVKHMQFLIIQLDKKKLNQKII